MQSSERLLADLRLTARQRRKEFKTRLIIAIFGAGIVLYWAEPVFALLWVPLVILSQLFDVWAWAPATDPKARELSLRRYRIMLISSVQASSVYSMIAVHLWFYGTDSARVFAFLWFGGAMLHVTLHMHHNRGAYFAGALPHAAYFFGIPLLALLAEIGMSRSDAVLILIAVGLYAGHLMAAFRTTRKLSVELSEARAEAEDRQAEAERANKAKSDFLSNMSHEIRTPLNGVLGMTEALKQEELPAPATEKVEVLHDSGLMLLRLLNDILDLSKIEAGRIELEHQPLDVVDVSEKVLRNYRHLADAKGIDLSMNYAEGIDGMRMGDELRLMQVLNNLLSNALKFTEEGEVVIHKAIEEETGDILISVRDTGIGMSSTQLAQVMEPFTQADRTITRRYGGTGLGLAIVNGLVRAMDGEVSIASTVGVGTTFTIRLPLKPCAEEGPGRSAQASDRTEPLYFQGTRVLVVDDHPVNRVVLESYLGAMQATVYQVEDGESAVKAAMENEFDLILMDVSMPGMSGVEAMAAIRAANTAPPPIIAVTGHVLSHETGQYIEDGFSGYLSKPVSLSALEKVMAEFIGTSSVPDEVAQLSA